MKVVFIKEIQILEDDYEGSIRPNRKIVIAQKITVNQRKDKIQSAYMKDVGAKELKRKKMNNDNIQKKESILYQKKQIYIPIKLWEEWVREIHKHLSIGYPEIGKTTELVARNYYFPEIIRTAQKIIKKCNQCN